MEKAQTNNDMTTSSDIELKVSRDKLTVLLFCRGNSIRSEGLIEDIKNGLTAKNIKAEPDLNGIAAAVDEAKTTGKDIVDLIIAKGKAPVMPVEGKVEWTRDYFVEGFKVDTETNRIDYHEKCANSVVEKGDMLVKVYPPVPGEPGLDVHGATIKIPPPKKVNLKAGPNVYFSEEESGYVANCSGRVELRGNTLDVLEVYRVNGNVGIETGNIHHNGRVVVNGNVETNFRIEAEGDIEIKGTMDPSDIVCGGNLTVYGGINGRHDIEFRVKGNITAKYIIGVSIECQGDIHIETEISQSIVRTEGTIVCDGRVVGGVMMAAKGIKVGKAGSKEEVETTLVAGISYRALAAIEAGNSKIEDMVKSMGELGVKYKQLKGLGRVITGPQKETMMEMEFSLLNMKAEIGKVREEIEKHKKLVAANRDAQITIVEQANSGTMLKVVHSGCPIEFAMLGPIVASLDKTTRKITLSSDEEETS